MQIIIIRVVLNMQVRRAFIKYVSLGPFTETKPNVMERFIGTDTAIFQHIHLRNWDLCHTVRSSFISPFRRSLPAGIGTTVWHSPPPLCHSENADADRTGISCYVRKDGNHWARGPGCWLNTSQLNSCRRCVDCRAMCGHRPGTAEMNFDQCYALYIQKLYQSLHFTISGC